MLSAMCWTTVNFSGFCAVNFAVSTRRRLGYAEGRWCTFRHFPYKWRILLRLIEHHAPRNEIALIEQATDQKGVGAQVTQQPASRHHDLLGIVRVVLHDVRFILIFTGSPLRNLQYR